MPASAQPLDPYSYNAAGGAPTPAGGSADDGTSIILGAAPTLAGYTFAGWYDGTATYAAGTSYELESDGNPIVFTAQWNPNATDDYSYASGGGTGTAPASGSGLDGTTITLATNTFTNSGYTFAGWYDGSATYAAGASYTLESDGNPIVFTAQWTAVTDNYSYASGGGTGTAPTGGSGLNGTSITLAANTFTRAGYTFDDWSDGTTTYAAGASYTLNSDGGTITFTAQWTANATDHYSYAAGGGTGTAPASGSGLNGTTITLAANTFTRAGYTFDDWSNGTTTYAAGASYTLSSTPIVFTAQWTANATDHYSYAAGGGTGTAPASGSGLNGTTITLATNTFTRTGYTFAGWSNGTTTYAAGASYTLSSTPIVFTAQWTIAGGGGPPPKTLTQTSPTSGVTTTDNSGTFTGGSITVSNATGAVSFVITSSSSALSVSPQGAITTSGTLLAGSYQVSGTDSDPAGDTGTWTYSLTVTKSPVTVTFIANGGAGSMAPESDNASTSLSPNTFTWAKHAFSKWTTAANGTGTSYANGATYPFGVAVTLYAQWVTTSHPAVKHKVTFSANGGSGTMATQTDSVLATLKSNGFTRTHYNFNDWNTAANDSGASYANGAPYNFKKSITLYAQWTLKPKAMHQVSFKANGGTGAMAPETQNTPGHLSPNRFTRAGYTFTRWNTSANDSGASYVNHSAYSFAKSATLYAQWSKKGAVIIPAVHFVVTLSPFVGKTATFSPTLEAEVTVLAAQIKANHDTKIALVGFSGELTTANESNEETWAASLKLARARADAVETFLKQQLATLGVTGYTITASGSTAALPVSANATAASQAANQKVVATLT